MTAKFQHATIPQHNMQPRIIEIEPKKLIGVRIENTLANNKVHELWQGFRPRVHEIANRVSTDFISMTVYPEGFQMARFTPQTVHQKWAAVEVSEFGNVPDGMETYSIPAGKYAVFLHRGTAMEAAKTYNYIFTEWLPGSGYELDDRPYFEVLGEKYIPTSPDSEEDICIPVK